MENGKIVLRNLQQQVGKNKDDIEALSQGIRIRGFGEDVPEDLKPGESWLKGIGPYELIVMTDGGQINLGQWPAKGPQGIPGPKGEGAVLGDVSTETTTLEPGLNAYVDVSKDGENLTFRFEIPQGERGIQGLKGETGPKGDTGPEGPQGPQGEARAVSEIVGTLESASALPSPSTVPSYYAYLVGTENNYTVYAIVGGVWKDIGNFTAIPGPQGPKGESYGTFTKTAENGDELGSILSGLTDTQSVVGAYATVGNRKVELIVISYTKAEMIYAWSTFADNPDVPTTATWQAVTSPEAGRFPVGDNYADSITLYIYDSSKSLMDKVSFLKLDDDGVLPQSGVPRYSGSGDIPKDSSTVKRHFGTGSFNLVTGKVLDCFVILGTTLNSAKMHGESEENIYLTDFTPLATGAMVFMKEGSTYKNYQVINNYFNGWSIDPISNYLFPINCRFKYILENPNVEFRNLSNCDISLSGIAGAGISVNISKCANASLSIDTKNCSEDEEVYFRMSGINKSVYAGLDYYDITSGGQTIGQKISIYPIADSNNDNHALHYKGSPYQNSTMRVDGKEEFFQTYMPIKGETYTSTETGKEMFLRQSYRLDILPSGKVIMDGWGTPDEIEATTPTMTKARAMSLQAEPIQAEPVEPNVPEDAIGIFSVDAEGNTINAMTGERL